MSPDTSTVPYHTLVTAADKLLEDCEEDAGLLAEGLGALDAGIRNELLVSDLLNAYQVFYYFFRTVPDELVKERMELEPASALIRGIRIDEIELLELFFFVKEAKPLIVVSDGEKRLAAFSGRSAYANGLKYLENPEYST
jgi:hypothetical protein